MHPVYKYSIYFLLSFFGCTINTIEKSKECAVLERLSQLDTMVNRKDTLVLVTMFYVNLFSSSDDNQVYISTVKEVHNKYLVYGKNGQSFKEFMLYFVKSYKGNVYNLKNGFYVDNEIMEEYKIGFNYLKEKYFTQKDEVYVLKENLSDNKIKTLLYLSFINNYFVVKNKEDGSYLIDHYSSSYKDCTPLFLN